MNKGKFVLSLDFEIYWGVHDIVSFSQYERNLMGAKEAVKKTLQLFDEFQISATWAIVDALRLKNFDHLEEFIGDFEPKYVESKFSPFPVDKLKDKGIPEEVLFAPNEVELIEKAKNQEVASHTFSHFYFLEELANIDEYLSDFSYSKRLWNENIETIIFPRNQYNEQTIRKVKNLGFRAYRGNPTLKHYKPMNQADNKLIYRIKRLRDAYFGDSNSLIHEVNQSASPINIPASLFLRPYSGKSFLESRKIKRIKKLMQMAAEQNKVFHLWWHPHNFGVDLEKNLELLGEILQEFKALNIQYEFKSCSMNSLIK